MSPDEKRELKKVFDTVFMAAQFHQKRDEMNATGHLANVVRYSPLTTELETTCDTLKKLINS